MPFFICHNVVPLCCVVGVSGLFARHEFLVELLKHGLCFGWELRLCAVYYGLRNQAVVGFCYAAGNGSHCVRIAAKRYGQAYGVFLAGAVEKSDYRLWHRALA